VSPLELVDDRFEQLAQELRAARPAASAELRERVRSLAPPPPPRFELRPRRVLAVACAAAVAISLSGALAVGLLQGGGRQRVVQGGARSATVLQQEAVRAAKAPSRGAFQGGPVPVPYPGGAIPAAGDRLQNYNAVLTLQVDDRAELAARTSQAMRLTRGLGGYVASAVYNVPGRRGVSVVALRIPIDRVQQALDSFSNYGSLLSQRITIKDRQRTVDELGSRIAGVQADIAKVQKELAGPLSSQQRSKLERQLRADQRLVVALTKQRKALVRYSELARVMLTLVTPRPKAVASPGRFDRTLDDAGSVLVRELEILLYALVVVGPLLLIGAAGLAAGRGQRRRSDRKLLERA
jgi:Domain of unknown function (DUF4349)